MRFALCNKNQYPAVVIFSFCYLIISAGTNAQSVSSTGKDFWLGYGAHAAMFNADGTVNSSGGTQEMRLYLSAFFKSTVTIEMPQTGWSKTITIAAGAIDQQVVIPKSGPDDARLTAEGVSNRGIHIMSDQPLNAWCHIYAQGSSASTLLVPEEILGQDYYALGTTQVANEANSFSYCFVVATENNTTVEITPSVNTVNHAAHVPFTMQLDRGQVLNLIGEVTGNTGGIYKGNDLSGTRIRTISNGVGSCPKIAVFSGSSNTSISCGDVATADNLFQQSLPYRAWGKTFYTVPAAGMAMGVYRVLINKPTEVRVNGNLLTNLVNGSYYEFKTDKVSKIFALNPVLVAQFITSEGECNNTANGTRGDPEMIYLTPYDYPMSRATFNLPQQANITSQSVNIVLKTVAIDSFTIDGALKSSFFKPFPIDTSYSYAQIPLSAGVHTLAIDTLSFTATAYGYGPFESYGFNGGFSITKLSSIAVKNPYSNPTEATVCKTIPFKIVFTLKRKATELIFDFQKNPALKPNNSLDLVNPVADSVYFNGVDSSYRYTLPASYVYSPTGLSTFNINIIEYIPTAEGCIEKRDVLYTINVTAKPAAGITLNYNTCANDALNFKDNSTWDGGGFKNWLWDFGDNTNIAGEQNPVKQYANYGDYNVLLRSITGNGCYADTSKPVSLNPVPKVNFGFNGLYCPLNDIQFTDSSSILNGWKISKREWSFGDGTTSTAQNPVKQYTSGGTFKVKLVVYSNKNCADSIIKSVTIYTVDNLKEFITVNNLNAVGDTLPVCRKEPFKLSVTFTLRQAEIHWDFGGNTNLLPNNNVNQLSPVPDSVYFNGTDSFFRYSLPVAYTFSGTGNIPVKITAFTPSQGGCLVQFVFNHNIKVLEKPVANWLLTYNQCSNDTLYFKDRSLVDGSTTKQWQWKFGDAATDDIANPIKKFANYGDYNVSLHIITATGCFGDTTMLVSLSPKPVAVFGFTGATYCPNENIVFTDTSVVEQPGKINKWHWNFGDDVTATDQNPFVAYTSAGNYTVTLITTTDHNCADTAVKVVNIFAVPTITIQPDFYIYAGTSFQLSPAYTGSGLTYAWTPATYLDHPDSANPVTAADKDITYTVAVAGDGGCRTSASVNIHVVRVLSVPNAFSPNGDGINDKWMITNIEGYPDCTVKVFNRYGQLVFNSVGYTKPWDGTYKGNALPVGTYYYIIDTKSAKFPGKQGDVTILR